MTVQINYKNSNSKKSPSNLVLFVDEKFSISGLKKLISNSEFSYISDLLKNSNLKKDLLVFKINSKKTIFLVSIKKDTKSSDIENLGAKFSISEVLKSFLMDTKNIVFFELISKTSKSFFESTFFNKSEIYVNSEFEKCFFNPLILNFSSTNKTRFDKIFFELLVI